MTSLRARARLVGAVLLCVLASGSQARGEVRPLVREDGEARRVFLRFAAMYSELGQLHERAETRTEVESPFRELSLDWMSRGSLAYEIWFQSPNLLRYEESGQTVVSDGARIVAPNVEMGFYAERDAVDRWRMRDQLASLVGRSSMLPTSALWLFSNNDKDRLGVFEDCRFRGSGADVIDGTACVWIDLAWEYEDPCGNSSSVEGFVWFAAETGRLRRIEIDTTDLENASARESFEKGYAPDWYDPEAGVEPYDRYVIITDIVESETPNRFDDWLFQVQLPEGLTRESSLLAGTEAAQKQMESRWSGEDQIVSLLGERAPGFSGTDGAGAEFDLESLRGSVVALHLNPMYPPINAERLEELESFAESHEGQGVVVVSTARDMGDFGMNFEETGIDESLAAFIDREHRLVRLIDDVSAMQLMSKVGFFKQRAVLLIDGDGIVQSTRLIEGDEPFPAGELAAEIATILAGGVVYDAAALDARRAERLDAIAELERVAPPIPDEDFNTEAFRVRRASGGVTSGDVLFIEDLNNDGYKDLLSNGMMDRYLFEDGKTGAQRLLRFDGVGDEMSKSVIGAITGGRPGLIVFSQPRSPIGPATTSLGLFGLDGRAVWRRTLQSGDDGGNPVIGMMRMPTMHVGDIDGDGAKEIVMWIRDAVDPGDRGMDRGLAGRLLVLNGSGDLIASRRFEDVYNVMLIESANPGRPGRLLLQGPSGGQEVTLR
ncbi:MAG: redoxin domain-containing protein [Phycisphaeraceae bacterium]|nr:redoxin domain-containing protein [Phycisphaeraceae bacterium]MCB9847157.1 redoxin domain-containing protein [Phycisphaeraceae bacterium]